MGPWQLAVDSRTLTGAGSNVCAIPHALDAGHGAVQNPATTALFGLAAGLNARQISRSIEATDNAVSQFR